MVAPGNLPAAVLGSLPAAVLGSRLLDAVLGSLPAAAPGILPAAVVQGNIRLEFLGSWFLDSSPAAGRSNYSILLLRNQSQAAGPWSPNI